MRARYRAGWPLFELIRYDKGLAYNGDVVAFNHSSTQYPDF
jgi:hypothetical protein